MKEFVELVNKYFHLRTAHSELVGFWTVELGAMNKAVHVWKYGTLSIPLRVPARGLLMWLLFVALTISNQASEKKKDVTVLINGKKKKTVGQF